jgi:S1-C subfamily serine protease
MKVLTIASVMVTMAGAAAVGVLAVPSLLDRLNAPVVAQTRPGEAPPRAPTERPRRGPFDFAQGSHIGATVRDLEPAESDHHKLTGGAVVEEVQADSPAARAGLRRADIIVVFDGEQVRSVRQFSRLVQETPAGRTVKATIVRDGQRSDVQLTPSDDRGPDVFIDGDRIRERLEDFAARLPELRVDIEPGGGRARLGATVSPLSDQLAAYFGAKEGVLVTAVADGSVAAASGLKAGDVITNINGGRVRTPQDLTRALRDPAPGADVTIGIVREKKETSLKAKLEATPPPRATRPI